MTIIGNSNFELIRNDEHIFHVWRIVNGEPSNTEKNISIEIPETLSEDTALFYIPRDRTPVIFDGYRFDVLYSGGHTPHKLRLVENRSGSFIFRNCTVRFVAKSQINFTAVYNYSELNSHLDIYASNMSVEHCRIDAYCDSEEYPLESVFCGIENKHANSVQIANNFLYVKNVGIGEKQRAYGIVNSGRYVRIENNNIKANGNHNVGRLLEQAHSCGVHNTGMYLVFTGNNCVAEWGGKCVGLYNTASLCNITANKILATHTIWGRTVILKSFNCVCSSNILTNTSRNPHFVDVLDSGNIISSNYMLGLMEPEEYKSGCGMFVQGQTDQKVSGCTISGNIVSAARDFGLALIHTQGNIIFGNRFTGPDGIRDYVAVYAEDSDDRMFENIAEGHVSVNELMWREKLAKNFDGSVSSLKD